MSDSYSNIRNAFLDGMNEVFTTMFTDKVKLFLLDTNLTYTNIYKESPQKVYSTPVSLSAKVVPTFEQGENSVEGIQISAEITVPTKQLILNNIPRFTEEDLETLRKAKFEYKGCEYLIEKVAPRTLVADEWQFYVFSCRVDKKKAIP